MSGVTGVPVAVLAVAAAAGLFWLATQPIADAIAARQAQLTEIAAEEAALEQRIAAFGVGRAVPALPPEALLGGATRTEAGLALQERLAALAEREGVLLTTLREGERPEGVRQPTLAVLAEGEGEYAAVAALLAALEAERPPLGVAELVLRPVVEGQARVSLRLRVWGFWGGEAG
jgi:hypothetical protein